MSKTLQCIIVTPEKTLRDTPADFVALALFDGEIGIAPGHTPMIGRLGNGELRITQAGRIERYYVEGGFVEVLDNVVSVLTGRAMSAAELDETILSEQLDAARAQTANTPELIAARNLAVAQCRAQLHIARRGEETLA